MIKSLEIKNFKSIKHLLLDCKRVNLFIGKPNAGKSNLLESVGILSFPFMPIKITDNIRLENEADLFHDHDLNETIEITAETTTGKCALQIRYAVGQFKGRWSEEEKDIVPSNSEFSLNDVGGLGRHFASPFKFYRFAVMDKFPRLEADFLLPPKGDNLYQILLTKKNLRKTAANLFNEYGLKMVLKQGEYKIELQKEIDGISYSYPYSLVSDTLQRVIFYHAAIETNKDSTLIFEEPEAHSFPFYTKFLAERIALDASNQYFITTHNPYFLSSVLEKTPISDVAIFITYMEDYQTKVRPIALEEMPEILDLDASVFFNLERFLGES